MTLNRPAGLFAESADAGPQPCVIEGPASWHVQMGPVGPALTKYRMKQLSINGEKRKRTITHVDGGLIEKALNGNRKAIQDVCKIALADLHDDSFSDPGIAAVVRDVLGRVAEVTEPRKPGGQSGATHNAYRDWNIRMSVQGYMEEEREELLKKSSGKKPSLTRACDRASEDEFCGEVLSTYP